MMLRAFHFIVAVVMTQSTAGVFIALKTFNSSLTEGSSYIECKSSTTFVIRTAYYTTTALSLRGCLDNCSKVPDRPTSDCVFSNGTCRQPMSLHDLLVLYRKCSRLQNGSCEAIASQITKPFEITYYCLDDEVTVDPCSEVRRTGLSVSLLVDYSRHSNASNLSCACSVESSNLDPLTVVAMNLFDPNEGEAGPEVAIGSLRWRWSLGRQSFPMALYLTAPNLTDVNNSVRLEIARPDDVMFGRTWLALEGSLLQVECSYTSQPKPKPISEFSNSGNPENCCLAYIAGGIIVGGCGIGTLLIVGIAKAWRQKLARKRKVSAFVPVGGQEEDRDRANDIGNDGGEYCQIGDKRTRSSVPMSQTTSVDFDQCRLEAERDNPDSVYANAYDGEAGGDSAVPICSSRSRLASCPSSQSQLASHPPSNQSRLPSCPPSNRSRFASHPPSSQSRLTSRPHPGKSASPMSRSSHSEEKNAGNGNRQVSTGLSTNSREVAGQDGVYGNVRRFPAKGRAAEAAIYDHASKVEVDGGDDVYDTLQRGPARFEVIDNIYDTTS